VGFTLVIGAPIYAVPVVMLVLGVMGALRYRRRLNRYHDIQEFREQGNTEGVDFTPRDKQTIVTD